MQFQTLPVQAGEDTKVPIYLSTAIVRVAQKAMPAVAHAEPIGHDKVERGWLGVSVQDLTPELAKSFGVESTEGALVAEVVKGGPAGKAGMKRGDIMITYAGKEITNASTLRNAVAIGPIGQEVKITVFRKGEKQLLTLKIGNSEDSMRASAIFLRDRFGAEVRPVTPKEAEKYNLNFQQGVAIVRLNPQGPLREVGFEVGDIILEVNGKAIESFESFVDLVNSLKPHQRITFLALDHRSGRTGYVQIKAR